MDPQGTVNHMGTFEKLVIIQRISYINSPSRDFVLYHSGSAHEDINDFRYSHQKSGVRRGTWVAPVSIS